MTASATKLKMSQRSNGNEIWRPRLEAGRASVSDSNRLVNKEARSA